MIKRISTTLIFLMLTIFCFAQIDFSQFEDLKFRNIGPAGMSGRVTAIDVDLSNKKKIIVGTASGGVWISENGGISWEPVFDKESTLSIGSVKIDQSNPDIVWVGTGEGNPRNSLNTGGGIFKSIDGGKSWKMMGLVKTKVIHRILIDPTDGNTVYVGAMGAPWGDNKERGLYKSTDGGKTWKNILYVDQRTGVAEMVMDPHNNQKLLVAMYDHRRTPWDFKSGGKGSGLYLTYDGGENWKRLDHKNGLPKEDLGRMGLAIASSNSDIIYALIESKVNGLYKSTDGGENWKLVAKDDIGNRPFYYAEIYVDPQNENKIYNLYTYLSRSEDGGKSFETIADYGNNVHPDHHALWIDPDQPSNIINGNDGGLNISNDGGDTWKFITNLPVGQFYHVNIDNDFPYNVYGGMQDNGSWVGPSRVFKRGGIKNHDFQELYFGDGFDVMPYRKDSRYGYAMSQGGNVGYYDRESGAVSFVKPLHPDGKELRFNWNAPIAQDPFNDCGVYFGSQYVHYSDDCGQSWILLSDDLTTNDTSKQKQDISGGLTIDATNAENHTTLLAISPSPHDRDVIWVGSDDGRLHITRDGGKTWKDLYSKLPEAPKGGWIPQIEASKTNKGEAFVVVNNYRKNDYAPYLYHTTNYGQSWKRIVKNKDVSSFVLSVVQDPEVSDLLFMGTDVGLYVSFDGGQKWQVMDEGFPHVQVSDLKIHPEGDLVIGTFGRSLWILDDITPLRMVASSGKDILSEELYVFDIKDAYELSYRSYDGTRFYAQGEYVGDNARSSVASIPIWLKPNKEKDEDEKKEIKISILDANRDTIRNFKREIGTGYQKVSWYLDGNNERFPSRRKVDPDADPNGGFPIFPGKYEVHVSLDSTNTMAKNVVVKHDPRIKLSSEAIAEVIAAADDIKKYVKSARGAWDNLQDVKNTLQTIKKVSSSHDTAKDSLSTWDKPINSKIDSLEKLFMQPKGLKGIQRNPNNLNSKLNRAIYYLSSGWQGVTANDRIAIKQAKTMTKEVVAAVNEFIASDWKTYRKKVKSLEIPLFKDIDPIKIE